jgi:hypothetical protein
VIRSHKGKNLIDQFDKSHLHLIARGVKLFNEQKYWECHEELEHHWLEEPGPLRNIYWAIIQVAAAMIHYRENNLIGARGLIFKAKEKIDRVDKMHLENDLLKTTLDWDNFKRLVKSVPAEPELSDFEELFKFRFKDPKLWN